MLRSVCVVGCVRMSLLELRAELERLKSNEHYARYLATEFDEAARDDVVRSFAQRFGRIESLVQQQVDLEDVVG